MKFETRNGITRIVVPPRAVDFSDEDREEQQRHFNQGHTLTASKQYGLCSCGQQWEGEFRPA